MGTNMANAFSDFAVEVCTMIDSKTGYENPKVGNFASRMTSPIGWLHDLQKYAHEVYQSLTSDDPKLTAEEMKRNLLKVAHTAQLAYDRIEGCSGAPKVMESPL